MGKDKKNRPDRVSFRPGPFVAYLFLAVTFPEVLDAALCIDKSGLARKERMTTRTSIHRHLFGRGTSMNHVPAGAGNSRVPILGMYIFFHNDLPLEQ
jgi:hypothetical protein